MNLLVVECNADWSKWSLISKRLRGVTVVMQHSDEALAMFYARILERFTAHRGTLLQSVAIMASPDQSPSAQALRRDLVHRLTNRTEPGHPHEQLSGFHVIHNTYTSSRRYSPGS